MHFANRSHLERESSKIHIKREIAFSDASSTFEIELDGFMNDALSGEHCPNRFTGLSSVVISIPFS